MDEIKIHVPVISYNKPSIAISASCCLSVSFDNLLIRSYVIFRIFLSRFCPVISDLCKCRKTALLIKVAKKKQREEKWCQTCFLIKVTPPPPPLANCWTSLVFREIRQLGEMHWLCCGFEFVSASVQAALFTFFSSLSILSDFLAFSIITLAFIAQNAAKRNHCPNLDSLLKIF